MSTGQVGGQLGAGEAPPGPPYAPQVQGAGGVPTVIPDVVVSAILLLVFICGAATHFTIFKLNMKKSHLFFLSMMTFGFCMCRIVTMILRIAWSQYPTSVRLALAANIFVQAGTLLLYVINLVFAQRIIRAQHPRLGWHRAGLLVARILITLVVVMLLMIIVVVVQSSYTADAYTHYVDRAIQLTAVTYYAALAFLPIPMVVVGLILPRRIRTEKFGRGRFRHKVQVLVAATLLAALRAGYSAGTAWTTPTPLSAETPWYLSKVAFYIFDFVPEICIVYLYAAVRVDRRFHVPNKSRGSYMSSSQLDFGFHEKSHEKLNPEKLGKEIDIETARKHLSGTESVVPDLPPVRPSSRAAEISRSVFGSLRRRAQMARAITFPYLADFNDSEVLHVYTEEELFDDAATLANTLRFSGVYDSTTISRDDMTGNWELKRHASRTTLAYSDATRTRANSFAVYSSRPSFDPGRSNIGGRESDSICDVFGGDGRSSIIIEPYNTAPMDPAYLSPSSVHRSRSQFYDVDGSSSYSESVYSLSNRTSLRHSQSLRDSRTLRDSRSMRSLNRSSRGSSSILDFGDLIEERASLDAPPMPQIPTEHAHPLASAPVADADTIAPVVAVPAPAVTAGPSGSVAFWLPPGKVDESEIFEGA